MMTRIWILPAGPLPKLVNKQKLISFRTTSGAKLKDFMLVILLNCLTYLLSNLDSQRWVLVVFPLSDSFVKSYIHKTFLALEGGGGGGGVLMVKALAPTPSPPPLTRARTLILFGGTF